VASALTSPPATRTTVEGESVLLETVPEIITKKIYHRGASITPRDIFDIAAAGEQQEASLVAELRNYRDEVKQALTAMAKLNTTFVHAAIAQLAIRDAYKAISTTAVERTKAILSAV
jgi:hypothetical protein